MQTMPQAITRFAQLLLVLTSLAPVGFVYSGVLFDVRACKLATVVAAASAMLAILCERLLSGARQHVASMPSELNDPSPRSGESLGFLVGYALPLLALENPTGIGVIGVTTFIVIVATVAWQQQIFHVNPVMALLGYKFIGGRDDAGKSVLIITKSRALGSGVLTVVKLSDSLWLHAPEE